MKASFVDTLLALCLTAVLKDGAAEVPHLGNVLFFQTPRDALDARDGRVLNSVSMQNTSHFYPVIDFGYKRTGSGHITYYGISVRKCVQYCRNSPSCLAINYQRASRICDELKTLGTVSSDSYYSTCLVKYKDGDDPCNAVYSLKAYGRAGYDYARLISEEAPTPKACCEKCREDPISRCVAWTYNTATKSCYLQDEAAPMYTSSNVTSGYAVVDPSEKPTACYGQLGKQAT